MEKTDLKRFAKTVLAVKPDLEALPDDASMDDLIDATWTYREAMSDWGDQVAEGLREALADHCWICGETECSGGSECVYYEDEDDGRIHCPDAIEATCTVAD